MSIISQRVKKMKPSPTLAVTAKANELKAQGKNIISLSVGEPDFDTPKEAKQGGIEEKMSSAISKIRKMR